MINMNVREAARYIIEREVGEEKDVIIERMQERYKAAKKKYMKSEY